MGADDQPTDEFEAAVAPATVTDPPVIAAGRTIGERYRLERRLGYGGMASVWLATDQRLDREVAVKVLSDSLTGDREYLDRFRREARVVAGLQHPNLVPVYDFGAGERPYLVMEYVPGGDLSERITAGETPPPEQLAAELLSALRHIHRAGVLHRDIKPQNVLVDESGSARLTDFGIAQPQGATSLTHTGKVIGTESYLAPEVMKGAPASERSDLYALGVVLADVARDGAGPDFWELTDQLREADPELRPGSAEQALALLGGQTPRRTLPGTATQPFDLPPADPPEPPVREEFEPPEPQRGGRGKLIGGLALAVLAIAAVAALALGGGDSGGGSGDGAANETAASEKPKAKEDKGSGGTAPADTEPVAEEPAPSEPAEAAAPAGGEADGAALNDEGYALVQQQNYEAAIPILEKARKALAKSGDETTYNYALFNLANAYLGAGQPDAAIPLLQERMQFDDGQLAEVQAALDEAYAAAGQTAPTDEGGPPANANGNPPPFED